MPDPERLLYAHRGARAEAPENTIPAFERALEAGAHALEMDARLTRDGAVVIAHDATGLRCAGVPAAIAASTLADVRAWDAGHAFRDPARGGHPFYGRGVRIPTLDEVLAAFPGVRLNVDLKARDPALVAAAVALVRAAHASDRVLLTSFHAENLRAIRAHHDGPSGFSFRECLRILFTRAAPVYPVPPRARLQVAVRIRGSVRLPRRVWIARGRALGLPVDFFTVNDPREAAHLLALGASGIMTDDPAALAPLFRRPEPARAPAAPVS